MHQCKQDQTGLMLLTRVSTAARCAQITHFQGEKFILLYLPCYPRLCYERKRWMKVENRQILSPKQLTIEEPHKQFVINIYVYSSLEHKKEYLFFIFPRVN